MLVFHDVNTSFRDHAVTFSRSVRTEAIIQLEQERTLIFVLVDSHDTISLTTLVKNVGVGIPERDHGAGCSIHSFGMQRLGEIFKIPNPYFSSRLSGGSEGKHLSGVIDVHDFYTFGSVVCLEAIGLSASAAIHDSDLFVFATKSVHITCVIPDEIMNKIGETIEGINRSRLFDVPQFDSVVGRSTEQGIVHRVIVSKKSDFLLVTSQVSDAFTETFSSFGHTFLIADFPVFRDFP